MNTPVTLAIFSVSAGAGHIRAAQAIERAAAEFKRPIKAVHVDLMTIVPELFKKMYADSYLDIVESHPTLWGYLYKKADREKTDSMLNKLRRAIQRLNTRSLVGTIAEINPDQIICTHFLPAELISRMIEKEGFTRPCWVQVTDFDVHTMWVHPHMTGYFTASDEVAFRLADRGIARDKITVTGIPISPAFSRKYSRETCAAELGVDPKKFTLLLMAGGAGLGGLELLAERLLSIPEDFQVIALAGKNVEMLEMLKAIATKHTGRLFPLGFTKTIERVMAVADVAVTKPGGLTTSECLAVGLPMIIVSPIPGQEERNSDYLLENGVALKAYDTAGLEFRVRALLAAPDRLGAMRRRALEIARPHAAEDVLKTVLGQ
ncbi:MAG: galactosyldiacylglycerol synthase [Candidatus Riflebacteria bacterium]|nr:galactosyldiacylglycerol synthase [Candidatus Riflebacteria bacterium]